jgi:hypothetical protein
MSFALSTCPFVFGCATADQSKRLLLSPQKLRNFFPKLGVVVGDDRVGYTEALDDVGEECYDFLGVDVHNGPSFNPLEELVNRHEVCEAPGRLSEWPHHLEMPHSESPCDGDGLKLLR